MAFAFQSSLPSMNFLAGNGRHKLAYSCKKEATSVSCCATYQFTAMILELMNAPSAFQAMADAIV